MPFESCPTCGYALSVHDPHCRHCPVPFGAIRSSPHFDAKHLSAMIIAILALSGLTYLVFFH